MDTAYERNLKSFPGVLSAERRSHEIPEAEDVYGWLEGSWELDVIHYRGKDTTALGLKGEAHFGWVLEGRAVQDVWIMPCIADRNDETDNVNNMYGTTLRVWDPAIRGWHITWINPVRGHREEQIGRRSGNDIVQVGARPDGTPTRWMFTEITPDTFHWTGESLSQDGKTWRLEGEFLARRQIGPR